MIKLIASDIDGTLVGHDLTFSPRVGAAVRAALDKGVAVTLATGRGATATEAFATQLGVTLPLVCLQGAQIYDAASKSTLHESLLPREAKPWIIRVAAEQGWTLHFETREQVILPKNNTWPPDVVALFKASPVTPVSDLMTGVPDQPHKFLIAVQNPSEREGVERLLISLVAQAGLAVDVVSSNPYLIEGIPAGVNKAAGLSWLTRQLGIMPGEVLALGDNNNDKEMLRWAGVGVALAGATPLALAAADWVAPSLADDGAAVAIEKYVLS
jgi:hypothetical protein